MTICTLVVARESAIRELIAMNLSRAGHRVGAASDGESALAYLRESLPDLVLLDRDLPGVSGLELARRLRRDERTRRVSIIMLTAGSNEDDRVSSLDAGADDCVSKPFSFQELVARVRTVMRRRAPHTADEAIEVHGLRLEPRTGRVIAESTQIALGAIEFRLLHYLVVYPECVHSRADLLDRVWGDNVFVEERTVDVHIRRLRASLEPWGLDQLIQTVRGTGYRLSARRPANEPDMAN